MKIFRHRTCREYASYSAKKILVQPSMTSFFPFPFLHSATGHPGIFPFSLSPRRPGKGPLSIHMTGQLGRGKGGASDSIPLLPAKDTEAAVKAQEEGRGEGRKTHSLSSSYSQRYSMKPMKGGGGARRECRKGGLSLSLYPTLRTHGGEGKGALCEDDGKYV